jgi:hypothetical protein
MAAELTTVGVHGEEHANRDSEKEQTEVVLSDGPELLTLITEMRDGLDDIRSKIQPLVDMVKEGQYATGNGISYLEVKHLMLLSYCECIVFYLLLKAEAISVRDHPVISRLVEIKLFLEKVGIPFRHDSNPVVASFSKDSVSKILSTCFSWSWSYYYTICTFWLGRFGQLTKSFSIKWRSCSRLVRGKPQRLWARMVRKKML